MADDSHSDNTDRDHTDPNSGNLGGKTHSSPLTRRGAMKAIGALSIGSIAISRTATAQSSDRIPKSLARKVAEEKVGQLTSSDELAKWSRKDVGKGALFELPVSDGSATTFEPAVYVFPITDGQGHIVISARTELPPVLSYGTGPAPQTQVSPVSDAHAQDPLTFEETLLYLGGMSYGVKATNVTADGSEQTQFVDLRTKSASTLPTLSSIKQFEFDTKAAVEEWREVRKTSPEQHIQKIGSHRSADDEVYGVPNWTEGDNDDSWAEWDGCSPIAASMAIGYYENTPHSDRDEVIDTLHNAMSTRDTPMGNGLTIPGDIPKGIGMYDEGDHDYQETHNNFLDIGLKRPEQTKNQIGDDNPLLLSTMPDVDLVGHTETVVGYDDASSFYYKCHDTYSETNWIKHKNWVTGFTTPVKTA